MMEIRLICSTRDFKIDSSVEKFVFDDFILSTDRNLLDETIKTNQFVSAVGLISTYQIDRNPHFISVENSCYYFSNRYISNEMRLSEKKIEVLQFFMSCLWFIKDCCSDVGYLHSYNYNTGNIHSRRRTVLFSNAKGEFNSSIFGHFELEKAREIFKQLVPILMQGHEMDEVFIEDNKSEKFNAVTKSDIHSLKNSSRNRIDRAFSFLTLARSNSFLPLKISFYIGFYEALFTTDKTEVSHKVTERVTLYLGGDYVKKKSTFSLIKKAYDVRSKYLHGQVLVKPNELLANIAYDIDNLTRELFTKIILEDSEVFLQKEPLLNDYFKDLILK